MAPPPEATLQPHIEYPDDDGLPTSDNSLQLRWILTIYGNLAAIYRPDANVFVGGNLLWYPVEGQPTIRTAPDVLVVFGRPNVRRGFYKQWEEEGIAPQVVFEVVSPGNRPDDMDRKHDFYDRYGVDEYYLYDPDELWLLGWQREAGRLQALVPMHDRVSRRLGIRFDMSGEELVIHGLDGRRFLTFEDLREQEEQARNLAEQERLARVQAQQRADQALQRAEQERQRADQERQRAEQLAERLRSLGIDPTE
jgi:Uma2 family endonuclease